MSYRTFKKLMGETSLERKCRFLFGGGLMLLITGSFYFYARLNARLVNEQTTETARKLVGPALMKAHWGVLDAARQSAGPPPNEHDEFLQDPARYFQRDSSLQHRSGVYRIDNSKDRSKRLPDTADYEALDVIRDPDNAAGEFTQVRRDDTGTESFYYFRGIAAKKSCLNCHYHEQDGYQPEDLIGIARIAIPMQATNRQLAQNNMVLLGMAIVTAFLAMVAAYAIVRYVIVKPVLHLKDVSDGIARGTLDLRADIRTGDEFEELSHAFNRMLRHLVTVQDELRGVNADLDAKVDELAQVNLQLYEMNKLKDEFLATMSHELRTPLNSILGFSDILRQADNLTDRQKRYLQNIRSSGEDLMTRINDVLDLAKIESGKMERQPVDFSLAELVERQVAALAPLAAQKNIDLRREVDPDLPDLFQDHGKVQQILTNLLSNAIKFTPEGGRVRVAGCRERTDADHVLLIVEDTGIGIRLEEQETIFEKFRQGRLIPGQEDTMTREYGGTGLGLSIVKELSKLLGGEVTLESEFGKGSTFTVRLPVRLNLEQGVVSTLDSVARPALESSQARAADRHSRTAAAAHIASGKTASPEDHPPSDGRQPSQQAAAGRHSSDPDTKDGQTQTETGGKQGEKNEGGEKDADRKTESAESNEPAA